MKKSLVIFLFGFILFDCHESTDSNLKLSQALDKNVGEQIPNATADRWMKRFEAQRSASRQKEDPSFFINSTSLASIVQQADLQGITFHNAIDPITGDHHIVLIPLIAGQRLFDPTVVVTDANTDSPIDLTVALAWIQHYQTENPNSTRYFYFGSEIFEEMLSNTLLDRVDMARSVNDESVIQLVLLAHNVGEGSSGGRVLSDKTVAYDMSALCPNACPGVE